MSVPVSAPAARWVSLVALFSTLLALWPATVTLAGYWFEIRDYQFGIPASLLCLAWAVQRSQALHDEPAVPSTPGIAAVVMCVAAVSTFIVANSEMLAELLLPPTVIASVWATAGRRAARLVAPPIAYLFLTIPWWDYLVPSLQAATVFVSEHALGLFGVAATVDGNFIHIPEGTFEIVEGCAGKKYFMVGVTLATLAADYWRFPWRVRAFYVGGAAVVALFTNWIRVITVIVAGHLSDMQNYLVAREHLTFGTALFGVMIFALAVAGRATSHGLPIAPAVAGPVGLVVTGTGKSTSRGAGVVTALLLLVLLLPTGAARINAGNAGEARLNAVPVVSGRWQGPLPTSHGWQPAFKGSADATSVSYRGESRQIEVYANVYANQSQGRELVHYGNRVEGGLPAELRGTVRGMNAMVVHSGPDRIAVLYSYRVGGLTIRRPAVAQVSYGLLRLIGRPAAGVIAVGVRCSGDCLDEFALLSRFWDELGSRLSGAIPDQFSPSR